MASQSELLVAMSEIDTVQSPALAMPSRPEGRLTLRQFLRVVRDNSLATYPPEALFRHAWCGSLRTCPVTGAGSTNGSRVVFSDTSVECNMCSVQLHSRGRVLFSSSFVTCERSLVPLRIHATQASVLGSEAPRTCWCCRSRHGDAAVGGVEGHGAACRHEDAEGRRSVCVDSRRDRRCRRLHALPVAGTVWHTVIVALPAHGCT